MTSTPVSTTTNSGSTMPLSKRLTLWTPVSRSVQDGRKRRQSPQLADPGGRSQQQFTGFRGPHLQPRRDPPNEFQLTSSGILTDTNAVLTWDEASDPGVGVAGYQIFIDSGHIPVNPANVHRWKCSVSFPPRVITLVLIKGV